MGSIFSNLIGASPRPGGPSSQASDSSNAPLDGGDVIIISDDERSIGNCTSNAAGRATSFLAGSHPPRAENCKPCL